MPEHHRPLIGLTTILALAAAPGAVLAQSDDAATLRLQTFGGDAELTAAQTAVDRFREDYPNVEVEIAIDPITNGWGEFVTKVLQQFNAGNEADVYHTAIETFAAFAARDLFAPLDERIAADDSFEDFDDRLFELSSYEGTTYYVPSSWNNIMFNANLDLFEEAGVAFPSPDWTWDDFLSAATALTERDESGNVVRFGYEVPPQFFFVQPWFFTNGTSIVNEDWTESNMLDPKVAETLQYLYDLIHVHEVSPIPGSGMMDNQFFADQVAMISRGPWLVQNARANEMNMDVLPPPEREAPATVIGFGGYAIAESTEHPELAWALIQELVSVETQSEQAERGGGVPGRRSAAQSEAFLEYPPSAFLYYETVPTSLAVPSPVNFQEVEQIFIRNYREMMADDISIEDGVQQTHDELTRSFERAERLLR